VIALLAALVFGTIAWRSYRKRDPLKGIEPGLHQSNPRTSGETLPLPSPGKK
jgi:hypothetical protein